MTAQYFADAELASSERGLLDGVSALETAFGCVLRQIPDAVLVLDERGTITYANRAASELLGVPVEGLLDESMDDFLWRPGERKRLLDGLVPGAPLRNREVELRRGDDSICHASVSASVARLSRRGKLRTLLYLRDLGARRARETELERRNEELEHCVHTLSHDLRSPLVALLGFSRLLRQDYGERLDETGRHFLDRIEQAGRTMEDLIHDLLELSRIDQPGERRTHVDPRSVLLQIQAELKSRLDAASVELQLPESPPLVMCDRTRLYQVFSNLIGNALDHMGDSRERRICVDVWEEPSAHHLVVRDWGRGIEPEHHERIFEVFQSLSSRADGRRGTGIGLAIVRKIAETHGGRAWVESQPGEGAIFHVTLGRR